MGKLMWITIVLIASSIAYLLGYYSISYLNAISINNNSYVLPIAPNQSGIASTNVQYTIDGTVSFINSDKTVLSVRTNNDKIFGPYKLDHNVLVQKQLSNGVKTIDKNQLKKGINIRISYIYKWTYDKKGSYISYVLIK